MTGVSELETVTVSWEPCPEFHDDVDAADGCCAECGWALDDHERALLAA